METDSLLQKKLRFILYIIQFSRYLDGFSFNLSYFIAIFFNFLNTCILFFITFDFRYHLLNLMQNENRKTDAYPLY